MADPLGIIGSRSMGGLTGPGGVGAPGSAGGVGGAGGASATGQGSFKDALLRNIDEVNDLQQQAVQASEDFATGKRADLENVLMATQKADTAFRMLLAVRNKVQAAYDELKQVRI